MRKLSHEEQVSRRQFDWRIVQRMNRPPKYVFSAHRTAQDAEGGRRPIGNDDDARYATHFRAEYHLRTLIGQNRYASVTLIRIDASAAGYPFEEPVGWVVENGESQMPWSPHFTHGLAVCNGTIWKKDGHVTLGHYLIHLARLLNWDEPLPPGYGGYTPEAVTWWQKHIRGPLDPDLRYPALPVDLLYGEVRVQTTGGFRPTGGKSGGRPSGGFRRVG